MTQSLLLDQTTWDLTTDASGNIAVASDPYATAQNVACAIRTIQGEMYYDTSRGVPYVDQVFSGSPSLAAVKALLAAEAVTVDGVASAKVFLSRGPDRSINGQVQFKTTSGQAGIAGIGTEAAAFVLGTSILGGGDEI